MITRKRKAESLTASAPVSAFASEDHEVQDDRSSSPAYEDPPPLPPSSGDIDVPESSSTLLFSVYGFVRSFSRRLFLAPFPLDDFVFSLNRASRDPLFDAVHLALLRFLKRHLEARAAEGAERPARCLRRHDWALLDWLTWPTFLIDFLYAMGHLKELLDAGGGWDILQLILTNGEYYSLPVSTKLQVLQLLCDEIMDSEELRAELELREDMDEEKELGVSCSAGFLLDEGPMRVHPRNAKTKACKDAQALKYSVEPETKPDIRKEGPGEDATEDGNSDECWLCGMDGMLICCDGCPSAYHSRCIGLNKAALREGQWFCPECKVNKMGRSCSHVSMGIRGAEMFGIDPYGRMFLGACDYLLVVGTSSNVDPFIRYYNHDDVCSILKTFSLLEQALKYADILKGISDYWEIHDVNLPTGINEHDTIQTGKQSSAALDHKGSDSYGVQCENSERGRTMESTEKEIIFSEKETGLKMEVNAALDTSDSHSVGLQHSELLEQTISSKAMLEATDENSFSGRDDIAASASIKSHHSNETFTGHHLSQMSSQNLILTGPSTSASGKNGFYRDDADSCMSSVKSRSRSLHSASIQRSCNASDGKSRVRNDRIVNNAASSKSVAYINQYVFGDIAASAAANLAVLMSDESRVSHVRASSNPRKAVAADIAMHMKAFSKDTMHFMWPTSEKKLMEAPRERCGWCIACQGASTTKKGCLLNVIAAHAFKASARGTHCVRLIKHEENHTPIIAAHILNMEESLGGLLVGQFLDAEYKKEWRKQLKENSSFWVLKILLLELEKNIRGIAFSESWNKPMTERAVEFSVESIRKAPNILHQKRGASGRQNKRNMVSSDSDTSKDGNLEWWRGGKFSKKVSNKEVLPSLLLKKIARQGGFRRVPGVCYLEDSEFPRRCRRFSWIASVETSKNTSQLALQVRYLDAHIRWRDLIRPEQVHLDVKGQDGDASVFRNAVICDMKFVENKQLYAVTFLNQKRLPLRVTKNIFEAEETEENSGKLWFSEFHIPLYLIREYEEKAQANLCDSKKAEYHFLPKMQRGPLKFFEGDIFLYLFCKGDKPCKCSCASCSKELSLRDAVKCKSCQGYCHEDCAISSNACVENAMKFSFTCKVCYHAQFAMDNRKNNASLSLQLSMREQEKSGMGNKGMLQVSQKGPLVLKISTAQPAGRIGQPIWSTSQVVKNVHKSTGKSNCDGKSDSVKTFTKSIEGINWDSQNRLHYESPRQIGFQSTIRAIVNKDDHPEKVSSVSASKSLSKSKHKHSGIKVRPGGLIWKKNADDTGTEFRFHNIILKAKDGTETSLKPICFLCKKAYCSDMMYICCEKCKKWYHADALQIKESQIFDLIGFKCFKCRRIKSPHCPYTDSYDQKQTSGLLLEEHMEGSVLCGSELTCSPNTESFDTMVADDPLLHASAVVEPITVETMEAKIQPNDLLPISQCHKKLPVRRHKYHDMDDGVSQRASHTVELYADPFDSLQKLPVKMNNDYELEAKVEMVMPEEADFLVPTINYQSAYMERELNLMNFEFGANNDTDFCTQIEGMDHMYNDTGFCTEIEGTDGMEYEPQTYFSFSELLASDDTQLDDPHMPVDCYPHTGFGNGLGTILQDGLSYNPPGQPCQMEIVNEEPIDYGLRCQKCNFAEPPWDLACEVCGLHIHYHCSPWVENEHSTDGHWRCGNCRDC